MTGFHRSDADKQAIIEALAAGMPVNKAAKVFSASKSTVKRYRDMAGIPSYAAGDWRAAAARFQPTAVRRSFNADGEVTGESVTLKPPLDPKPFAIPDGHRVRELSTLVNGQQQMLLQWVKSKDDGELPPEKIAEIIRDTWSGAKLPALPRSPRTTHDTYLTVYPIPDFHLGMLAWGRETGVDYDLEIAQRDIMAAVDELVACSPPSRKAVVLVLGDYFHADDDTNQTPGSKHTLDHDGRAEKVAFVGVEIMHRVINRVLERHASAEIVVLPGNHDRNAYRVLKASLHYAYKASDRVNVDLSPNVHWYYRHGVNLLGASHGHTLKPPAMAAMMAVDRREDWGQTKHQVFFYGHYHHESVKEHHGVRVVGLGSPAPRDAYANAGGWRSGRSLSYFTYCSERGPRPTFTLPM